MCCQRIYIPSLWASSFPSPARLFHTIHFLPSLSTAMLPSILLTTVLALVVTALPQSGNSCNPTCCEKLVPANEAPANRLITGLGIVAPVDSSLVGMKCLSPVRSMFIFIFGSPTDVDPVIGKGLPPCSGEVQPACCTGNTFVSTPSVYPRMYLMLVGAAERFDHAWVFPDKCQFTLVWWRQIKRHVSG